MQFELTYSVVKMTTYDQVSSFIGDGSVAQVVENQFEHMDIAKEQNTCLKCCMINHKWCLMCLLLTAVIFVYAGSLMGQYLSSSPFSVEQFLIGLNSTRNFFSTNDLPHSI